jgi:acyl-CoA synthetase (AMP-forming)/AMP-acid ligase II
MTEAASQITTNPLVAEDRRPGSVGRSLDVEVRVVDGVGAPVPPNTVGAVEIRGDSVVSCYWAAEGGRLVARPARNPDGWLATGDIGRCDEAGFLYLAGRSDDVINRGGEKLYPREIEDVLVGDPDVSAAAVVARPHDIVGEEPVAIVLLEPGRDPADAVARLAHRCTLLLSRFKQPAAIVVANELPIGVTGKMRRAEIRRLLHQTIQAA